MSSRVPPPNTFLLRNDKVGQLIAAEKEGHSAVIRINITTTVVFQLNPPPC